MIDYDTPTPHTIGLNGEWGSGKTSLVKRTYLSLFADNKDERIKIVWFDAWEYERLDPVSALLYYIAMQYPEKKRRRFEKLSSYLRHTLNVVRPFSPQIEEAASAAAGVPIPVVAVANVPYETIMKDLSSNDMSNPLIEIVTNIIPVLNGRDSSSNVAYLGQNKTKIHRYLVILHIAKSIHSFTLWGKNFGESTFIPHIA